MDNIFREAQEAARTAVAAKAAELEGKPFSFDCGFAWVVVRPARGPFISWIKKQIKDLGFKYDSAGNILTLSGEYGFAHTKPEYQKVRQYGYLAYGGGWQFWEPGAENYRGQSISVFEAGARAFASVLISHGINASVGSRLD